MAPYALRCLGLVRVVGSSAVVRVEPLRDGLAGVAEKWGIGLRQTGPVTMPMVLFDNDPDLRKGYFWCGEMVSRGIYMHPFHNMFISNALTLDDITQTLAAADGAFEALAAAGASLEPNTRLRA